MKVESKKYILSSFFITIIRWEIFSLFFFTEYVFPSNLFWFFPDQTDSPWKRITKIMIKPVNRDGNMIEEKSKTKEIKKIKEKKSSSWNNWWQKYDLISWNCILFFSVVVNWLAKERMFSIKTYLHIKSNKKNVWT